MANLTFSPRKFLRARRPERFSDSTSDDTPVLDRSILEYHLETLTSRNQETEFERFAKRLAENTVCPNLIPQTGPTGGGDSKVDSETFPVAEEIALAWYIGEPSAASERWGFAFSAKKAWKPKLKSDVTKAVQTGRGYQKVFFVTNQFVKDKERGEIEDELSREHSVDVRILDRSWILDKVFSGHLEAIAIEELGLTVPSHSGVRPGPLDSQRAAELERLESRIRGASQTGYSFSIVDNCLEAALTARGLDKPRVEVDGLFLRAARVAEQYGTPFQQLAVAYNQAWTAFWWHEDVERFAELYGEVEKRAVGTQNAYELELLTNLWFLLRTAVAAGKLSDSGGDLARRTEVLQAELTRLSKVEERPSTALQAETNLLLTRLMNSQPDEAPAILDALQSVLGRTVGLIGYPIAKLARIISEIPDAVSRPWGAAFDRLFEAIVEVEGRRAGEIAAARLLLKRGEQLFRADDVYETIRVVGRALTSLYKHESRHEFVRALSLCSAAYERVGLLWAARGAAINAASVAANDFHAYQNASLRQVFCYRQVKWLELQLGRLPQLLSWHLVDTGMRRLLADDGYDTVKLFATDADFDGILAILLLRSETWDLKQLSLLPDTLERQGLVTSALALKFALGHDDVVSSELPAEAGEPTNLVDLFSQLRSQSAAELLPPRPLLYEERKVGIETRVLGCRIIADCESDSACVALCESILAALESLAATGMVDRMAAREPIFTIEIARANFSANPFGFELVDRGGRPHLKITCAAMTPFAMSTEEQVQIRQKIHELLTQVFARLFLIDEVEATLQRLFGEDRALDRAIGFTSSFGPIGNVLGSKPQNAASDWQDRSDRQYALIRADVWDGDERRKSRLAENAPGKSEPIRFAEGDPPPELLDSARHRHTDIETISVIREPLWDQANWSGTLFLTTADGSEPPILGLVFADRRTGEEIFEGWISELGQVDVNETVRVSIVRGISGANPAWYRVIIGTNPAVAFRGSGTKLAFLLSRINEMQPEGKENLQRFIDAFARAGRYYLSAASVSDGTAAVSRRRIEKREFFVKDAWQIGPNDPDCVAVHDSDDVIIPAIVIDPPVQKLREGRRRRAFSPKGDV